MEEIKKDLEYLAGNVQKVNELWSLQEVRIRNGNVIKRLIRKMTYWLYKPVIDQQTDFNMYMAAAISDIYRISSNNAECFEYGVGLNSANILPEDDKPRIVQLVSSLNFGDAVGNEVIAYKKMFEEAGYTTQIFAETIHKKIPAGVAYPMRFMPKLSEKDIIIYHFSSQCGLFEYVKSTEAKVVLRYHNITPPAFFKGYDENAEKATTIGLKQVAELKKYVDYCLPVSEFNKLDLLRMGYTCEMQVVPILVRFEDYEQEPSKSVIDKYSDGRTNILFVGRMAPNKKVEDVISSFHYYKKNFDAGARLFLVGSYNEADKYYKVLKKSIAKLGVKDVIFPGHIPFTDILAYYRIADVFLCLSEHEGFCVPLVEAMYFEVPIVAYRSCAVPDTMGEELVLLDDKSDNIVARHVDSIVRNEKIRNRLTELQNQRLLFFKSNEIKESVLQTIKEICLEIEKRDHKK